MGAWRDHWWVGGSIYHFLPLKAKVEEVARKLKGPTKTDGERAADEVMGGVTDEERRLVSCMSKGKNITLEYYIYK